MLDLLFLCSTEAFEDDLAYDTYNMTFIKVYINEYLLRSAPLHSLVNMTRLFVTC